MRGCKGKDTRMRWHDRDGEVCAHERRCEGGGMRDAAHERGGTRAIAPK